MKRVAFINKESLELIDHCAYPVEGGVPTMPEFYGVIIEAPRPIPTVEEVQAELTRLRELYPDEVKKFTDEDGNEQTNIVYGKYSEHGVCCEPFAEIGGVHGGL